MAILPVTVESRTSSSGSSSGRFNDEARRSIVGSPIAASSVPKGSITPKGGTTAAHKDSAAGPSKGSTVVTVHKDSTMHKDSSTAPSKGSTAVHSKDSTMHKDSSTAPSKGSTAVHKDSSTAPSKGSTAVHSKDSSTAPSKGSNSTAATTNVLVSNQNHNVNDNNKGASVATTAKPTTTKKGAAGKGHPNYGTIG